MLDDGWFKGRNDPSSSLGDWAADTRKLPQGLPGLCKKINLLGLDMGLWVEPEAISPDSDLYRATQTGRSAFPAGSLWRSGSSTRWISAARRW